MATTPLPSRAQAVRDYLATHPDGATCRQLVDAIEPGHPSNSMAATLISMVGRGKLRRHGKVFIPTPETFLDSRTPKSAVSQRRPRKPQPTPPESVAIDRAFKTRRTALVETTTTKVQRDRDMLRSELSRDVQAFLARGGQIQKCAPGERSAVALNDESDE